ncbi:MAG: response regulator [Synergistaceae bacterium]|jgi:putative two-component system response regulator|nr:response regulator [Synergistaceae bacterium]
MFEENKKFEERKKIVLVDDAPFILKLGRNALMEKYDVFTMPSAAKMFQFLETTRPDLILLDVLMPEMDGYEAIDRLKRDPGTADIPVIFLTSRSNAESELEGLSRGAVDYISKPFSSPLLLKRVDIHLLLEDQKSGLANLNRNLTKMVEQKMLSLLTLQKALLGMVSDLVDYRDDVTGEHVERTTRFLEIFLDEMRARNVYVDVLDTWDRNLFLQSAQLHDVGKIAIRDNILMKPARLTPEEFEEMKKHALLGEILIEKAQRSAQESDFLVHARVMAGYHHERWDGRGYPRKLARFDIPLQGRLMALADVYDALVSARPYKPSMTHEEAVRTIDAERGGYFEPILSDIFLSSSDRFRSIGQME